MPKNGGEKRVKAEDKERIESFSITVVNEADGSFTANMSGDPMTGILLAIRVMLTTAHEQGQQEILNQLAALKEALEKGASNGGTGK